MSQRESASTQGARLGIALQGELTGGGDKTLNGRGPPRAISKFLALGSVSQTSAAPPRAILATIDNGLQSSIFQPLACATCAAFCAA